MPPRLPPDGLDPVNLALPDGYYVVRKSGARFRDWYRLVAGANATLIPDAGTQELSIAATPSGVGVATPWPFAWNAVAGTNYFCPFNVGTTSSTTGAGTFLANAFFIGKACTVASLNLELVSGTGSSAVIRLGLYDDAGVNGQPGHLIGDAGTITNGAVGFRNANFGGTPLVISNPGLYWLCAKTDTAAGTWRAHGTSVVSPYLGGSNTRADVGGQAAGAMPSTAPTVTPNTSATGGLRIGIVFATV